MAQKEFELTGKVALVVGGATSLGRALALALAEAGADVAVTSCTQDKQEEQSVPAQGGTGQQTKVTNAAEATINGLESLRRPDEIARLRGLDPDEFLPSGLWQAYKESERGPADPAPSEVS